MILDHCSKENCTQQKYWSCLYDIVTQKCCKELCNSFKITFGDNFHLPMNFYSYLSVPIFANCRTKKGKKCIFPFNYQGHTYKTCIDLGDTAAWCATKISRDGSVIKKEACDHRSCNEIQKNKAGISCYIDGLKFVGNHLDTVRHVMTPMICQHHCKNHPYCSFFVLNRQSNNCHLKHSIGNFEFVLSIFKLSMAQIHLLG